MRPKKQEGKLPASLWNTPATVERLCCPECGSDRLQTTRWTMVNDGAQVASDPPLDEDWCPDCEKHVRGPVGIVYVARPLLEHVGTLDALDRLIASRRHGEG